MAQTTIETTPKLSRVLTVFSWGMGTKQTHTKNNSVGGTCYEEVAMLFQGLTVFPDNMVQTQVQLIKCQCLLCVGCSFTCWIVVCLLKQNTSRCLKKRIKTRSKADALGNSFD